MTEKNSSIQGPFSISGNLTVGGNSTTRGNAKFEHNLEVKGWLKARNIVGPCKGLFASETKLNSYYPKPENGWWALVGNTLPAEIYRAEGKKWVDTGVEGGEIVPYLDELEETVSENKNNITSLQENKQDNLTFDDTPKENSTNPVKSGGIKKYVDAEISYLEENKQNNLTFDNTPTEGSNNPVTSGGIKKALDSQKSEVDAAKDSALSAISDSENDAIANFNAQRVTPEMLSESTKQLIEAAGGGTINNLPDDEDLTSKNIDGAQVLKFNDKQYNKKNFSGLGRKYLRKNIQDSNNILTQDMLSDTNTIYIIQYDYDLNGAKVNIPSGCVLLCDGGSIKNGTINGNCTRINDVHSNLFDLTTLLNGTFNIPYLTPELFGAVGDGISDDTEYLQHAIDMAKITKIFRVKLFAQYKITSTLYLKANCGIVGNKSNAGWSQQENPQIIATFDNVNSWIIDTDTYRNGTDKIDYQGIVSGSDLDNSKVNACDSVYVRDLVIESTNGIYGGIRFLGAPGYRRFNVGIRGTKIGYLSCASWGCSDDYLFATSSMYGLMYAYDVNGVKLSNCYINCDERDIDLSTAPSWVKKDADHDLGDFANSHKCGIYLDYTYGIIFDNVITEHWEVARYVTNSSNLIDNSPYIEDISKGVYIISTSSVTVNGMSGFSNDSEYGFYLGTSVRLIINNVTTKWTNNRSSVWYNYIKQNNSTVFEDVENRIYTIGEYIYDKTISVAPEDDFVAILKGLVSGKRYIIQLKEGTYYLDERIEGKIFNLVFLGAGKDKTKIIFNKLVADTYIGMCYFKPSGNGQSTFIFSNLSLEAEDAQFTDPNDKGMFYVGSSNIFFHFYNVSINTNSACFMETNYNISNVITIVASYTSITCGEGGSFTTSGYGYRHLFLQLCFTNVTLSDNIANTLSNNAYVIPYYTQNTPPDSYAFEYSMRYDNNTGKTLFYHGGWKDANGNANGKTSGATSDRPSDPNAGYMFFDTTLNKPIWWSGTKWVDSTGLAV